MWSSAVRARSGSSFVARIGLSFALACSASDLTTLFAQPALAQTTPASTQAQEPQQSPKSQRQQAPSQAPSSSSQPYQPPVITFPDEGLTLEEAVRQTLQHDPALKIQQTAVRQQRGVAQEQQGAFDTTLSGRLSYEYRQQELPQSRKDLEQEKRTDLSDEIAVNRRDYNKALTLIERLRAVRDTPVGPGQADAISAIDPDVASQLRAIDLLIGDQQTPAVRDELRRIRQDYIDRTVARLQEGAQSLVSGFEGAERDLVNLGATPRDEVFYTGVIDLQVSKRLRNGISFAPFVNGQIDGTNYRDKPTSSDFGGKGLEDLYTFKAGVSATVPLLRGRGSDATGAAEKAARLEADASAFALQHQAAVSVFGTVRSYWALRAAQGTVEVARNSVELQDKLVELARASIQAGELAQVELARVQASQARSHARLRDAERGLVDARVALAIAMGVAAQPDDRTLPRARDEFPRSPTSDAASAAGNAASNAAASSLAAGNPASNPGGIAASAPATSAAAGAAATPAQATPAGPGAAEIDALIAGAGTRRNDAQATTRLEESGRVLQRGAQTEIRPRLDVQNTTWATALDERTASNALDRWVGPSTNVSLEIERPFGNNLRRGRYAQREAEAQQRQIDRANLQRRIALSVIQSTQGLQLARARVDQARASADAYQQTVDAEFERFRAGEATLIDAILTETQRVSARLDLIAAERDLATLIAQLRFDAGLLVTFANDQPLVNPADLVTAPGARP